MYGNIYINLLGLMNTSVLVINGMAVVAILIIKVIC